MGYAVLIKFTNIRYRAYYSRPNFYRVKEGKVGDPCSHTSLWSYGQYECGNLAHQGVIGLTFTETGDIFSPACNRLMTTYKPRQYIYAGD